MELTTKLHQQAQEALALSNQSALETSMNKLTRQLRAFDHEICPTQSSCEQLEAPTDKLENAFNEKNTMNNHLRQEKDILSSQVISKKNIH